MRKSSKIILLAAALLALALCGIALTVYMIRNSNRFEKNITIGSEGEVTETLEIKGLGLYPGASRDYDIHLKGNVNGTFALAMAFEDENSGILKDYLTVTVILDGESEPYKLTELFAGKTVERTCELKASKATTLTVRYTMDKAAGNDTQHAKADFKIVLSVRNV